ncbi:MAG: helix-turn-helix transcriptional regulator [Thermodesulfovibrionales bacterium]|nr:helix-turn-helix transcriptional regulator [Thermodesulfovibrionales bacterium]
MNEKILIGKRIQELRKKQKLSQEQIAEKIDISPNYLSRIECGKENPTLDMLIKLSNALEVEMWEMFDFGHAANRKELKDAIHDFTKTADDARLSLAFKIIRAVSR